MATVEDNIDLDVEFGAVDFGLGVPLDRINKSANDYIQDLENKRYHAFGWNPVKGGKSHGYWDPIVNALYSSDDRYQMKGLYAILAMSKSDRFTLDTAPGHLIPILCGVVGVYDTCVRREKIEKRLEKAQKLSGNKKFVELSVHPCLVRHFMCTCVDIFLPLMIQFDPYVVMKRLQQQNSIPLETARTKMNLKFLERLEKFGVGDEEIFWRERRSLVCTDEINAVGKKYSLIASIVKNLCKNKRNLVTLASEKVLWRFCLILIHCVWEDLRNIGLDLLGILSEFMRLEAPSENCTLAGLYCVITQGMKSSNRFSLFASVRVIRMWIWVADPTKVFTNLVNVRLAWNYLQLATHIPRMMRLLAVPEREVIMDVLSIMRVLTKCNDNEKLCGAIGRSNAIVKALIFLLFARETDFDKTPPFLVGMNEYLRDIIERINGMEERAHVAATTISDSDNIRRYRYQLQTLREIVTGNPTHRFSESEVSVCRWAMERFSSLKPPPLLETLLRDKERRRKKAGLKMIVPSVPEYKDVCSCKKIATQDSHSPEVAGLAVKMKHLVPSKDNQKSSILGNNGYFSPNLGMLTRSQNCAALEYETQLSATGSLIRESMLTLITDDDNIPEKDTINFKSNLSESEDPPLYKLENSDKLVQSETLVAPAPLKLKTEEPCNISEKLTQLEEPKRITFVVNQLYRPEDVHNVKVDTTNVAAPVTANYPNCQACSKTNLQIHRSGDAAPSSYIIKEAFNKEAFFVTEYLKSFYEVQEEHRVEFNEMYTAYKHSRLSLGLPFILFCPCKFLECLRNAFANAFSEQQACIERATLVFLKGIRTKKVVQKVFVKNPHEYAKVESTCFTNTYGRVRPFWSKIDAAYKTREEFLGKVLERECAAVKIKETIVNNKVTLPDPGISNDLQGGRPANCAPYFNNPSDFAALSDFVDRQRAEMGRTEVRPALSEDRRGVKRSWNCDESEVWKKYREQKVIIRDEGPMKSPNKCSNCGKKKSDLSLVGQQMLNEILQDGSHGVERPKSVRSALLVIGGKYDQDYPPYFSEPKRQSSDIEFVDGYFSAIPPYPGNTVTDEAYYQSTDFSRVLRNRTQMCGKNHEVSIFLPSSKDKQAKVGPVAWDIVKLVCNILCTILKHSTIAQSVLKDYESQISNLIACNDYIECSQFLIYVLNLLRKNGP